MYTITPRRRKLFKPLVHTSYKSFAIQCVKKNKVTKAAIVRVLGQVLQTEIAAVSSDDFESLTRDKSKEALLNFEKVVATINDEMKCKAPTVLAILMACLKTKKPRINTDGVIALIFSVMCKHRRPSACLIQRIVSLVLYGGHASKMVSVIKLKK